MGHEIAKSRGVHSLLEQPPKTATIGFLEAKALSIIAAQIPHFPTMHSSVLPAIKAVTDGADFSQTVRPYLPQLSALPQLIYNALRSGDKLHELRILYLSTNPLIFALALSLFLGPVFLIVSEINKNYSQVDRAWSILPTVYIAHYSFWAHQHGLPTQRLDNILLFAVTWSVRLTYNYWRRGGYSIGSEDYRWEHIKKFLSPTGMFLFNVAFISFAQSV